MEAKKNPSADIHQMRPLLFSLSLVLSLSITITAFEWKSKPANHPSSRTTLISTVDEILEIPPTNQPPPPPQVQPTKIIEVKNEEEIIEEVKIIFDLETMAESKPEEFTIDPLTEEEEEITDEIFLIVESPPSFSGGENAFRKFVISNLNYPAKARRMGIEGKVYIKCVIERDGSVTNAEVIKGIGAGCDEEALRVINISPNWVPGKQRGKPVRVSMVFPLIFKMG